MQSLSVPLLVSTNLAISEPIVSAHGSSAALVFSGETRFVSAEDAQRQHEALTRHGVLVVQVACDERGGLAEKIEARVETELAARGASSPGMGADDAADTLLSDQLFRARKLGHRGLCVSLAGLMRLTAPVGGLDAVDARTLQFYARACRERPIALLLRDSDRELVAYVSPMSIAQLLGVEDSSEAEFDSTPAPVPVPVAESVAAPVPVAESVAVPAPVPVPAPDPVPVAASDPEADFDAGLFESRARVVVTDSAYKPWLAALVAARGPQPLASFERIFAQSYMPLANAIAEGLADPKAIAARDEFSRTFARAYTDACPTFAVTGKRPKMVLDAHDLAKRLARMHGARTAHLVMVDAMRWDVGAIVRDELAGSLNGRATLAAECALFAALPTVTSRQLEGLTRGVDALRIAHDADRDADPVRGRTAEVIRRVKVGSRDVFKLDAIEAGLAKAQAHALDVLPELAQNAADSLAKHIKTLAPRTLVFIFGDHGFIVDHDGVAHHGGAAPEEVIVPSFAFLTGEVH